MRNYQVLTLVGGVIGILIFPAFYIFISAFDAGLTSYEEATEELGFSGDTTFDRKSDMAYVNAAAPLGILLLIIAIVLVFVITKLKQVKRLGIGLIAISIIVPIATSWYGILPFALLLPAGIIAARYKPKEGEDGTVYRADGSPVK